MDSDVQPSLVEVDVPDYPKSGEQRQMGNERSPPKRDDSAQPRSINEEILSTQGGEIIIPNYIENLFYYLGVYIKDEVLEGAGKVWVSFWKVYFILSSVLSLVDEALIFKVVYVNSFLQSGATEEWMYIFLMYSIIHGGLILQLLYWVISKNCKFNQLMSILAHYKTKSTESLPSIEIMGGYLPAFLIALATFISAVGFWNTSTVSEMELGQKIIGGVGCGLDFFSTYTKFLISFVILFSSLTLDNMMEQFVAQLSTPNLSAKVIEKNYQVLLRLTKCIDGAFGNMFVVIHVENFVLTQTIIRCVLNGADVLPILMMTSRAALNYLAYSYAVSSAGKVAAYRTWLGNKENRENLNWDVSNVRARLHELIATPIGTVGVTAIHLNKQFVAELAMGHVLVYFILINIFGRQQGEETGGGGGELDVRRSLSRNAGVAGWNEIITAPLDLHLMGSLWRQWAALRNHSDKKHRWVMIITAGLKS